MIAPDWLNLKVACPFAQQSFYAFSPWCDQTSHYGNFINVKCLFTSKNVHFENANVNVILMLVLKSEFVY